MKREGEKSWPNLSEKAENVRGCVIVGLAKCDIKMSKCICIFQICICIWKWENMRGCVIVWVAQCDIKRSKMSQFDLLVSCICICICICIVIFMISCPSEGKGGTVNQFLRDSKFWRFDHKTIRWLFWCTHLLYFSCIYVTYIWIICNFIWPCCICIMCIYNTYCILTTRQLDAFFDALLLVSGPSGSHNGWWAGMLWVQIVSPSPSPPSPPPLSTSQSSPSSPPSLTWSPVVTHHHHRHLQQ